MKVFSEIPLADDTAFTSGGNVAGGLLQLLFDFHWNALRQTGQGRVPPGDSSSRKSRTTAAIAAWASCMVVFFPLCLSL